METISERFIYLLKRKGVSVYACSEATGISQSTLGYIKSKNSTPNLTNRKILADFLDCSVDFLVNGKNEKDEKNQYNELFKRFKKSIIDFLIVSDNLEESYLLHNNSKKIYSRKELIRQINSDSEIGFELMNDLMVSSSVELFEKGTKKMKNFKLM